jgi:hypothetical protein
MKPQNVGCIERSEMHQPPVRVEPWCISLRSMHPTCVAKQCADWYEFTAVATMFADPAKQKFAGHRRVH